MAKTFVKRDNLAIRAKIYHFSRIWNVHLYLYSFCFIAPVEGLCCKPKYRANIFHHFIFVFFLYFSHHSSCRKDQFTVVILKFGTQDFTDPDLLNIRLTFTSLSLWFCLHKSFLCNIWNHRPADLMFSVLLSTIHLNVKSCTKKIFPYCGICYAVQCKF